MSPPVSIATRNRAANQIGSMPNCCTMGTKIGSVISMIGNGPMNIPMKTTSMIIMKTIASSEMSRLRTASTIPKVAPVKARSCEKVTAPDTISSTMTEMLALENIVSPKTLGVRRRRSAASSSVAKAPVAAASLGVAMPRKMTPTTEKTITDSGRMLTVVAVSFFAQADLRNIEGRREMRLQVAAAEDVEDVEQRHQEPRHDDADQDASDRDIADHAQNHRQR